MKSWAIGVILAVAGLAAIATYTGMATDPCAVKPTLPLRLRCQLVEGSYADSTPEACQGRRESVASCYDLHNQATSCREGGDDVLGCYREAAGVSDPLNATTDTQALRDYLLFLLDDLEVRAVTHYATHDMSAEQASSLLSQIISVKKAVLARQPARSMRVLVSGLAADWDRTISS